MKSLTICIALFISNYVFLQSTAQFEGTYQGKNIYVYSPSIEGTDDFCISEIFVNYEKYALDQSSTAFEIKLDDRGLKVGDPLVIRLIHEGSCIPKILNLNALTATPPIIRIEPATLEHGILKWKYNPDLTNYQIEHYRWNKWVVVNSDSLIPEENGFCEYDLSGETHNGTNTFRITAEDIVGFKGYSNNLTMQGSSEPVTWKLIRGNREIEFSDETRYELYSEEGDVLLLGTGTNIILEPVFRKVYYLNFDNRNEKIKLK